MTIDEHYALPAACLIGSLADTSSASIEQLIVVGCELSERVAGDLCRLADRLGLPLEVRDVGSQLRRRGDLPVGHLTLAAWARLLVPETCKDVERCLYLDADMVCVRDIGPLMDADLGPHALGAVQDVFHPTVGGPVCLPGLDLDRRERRSPYFNAGVLLIDVAGWRDAGVTEQAFRFVRDHPDSLRFWDQDALNAVMIGQWQPLDRRWNVPPVRDILHTLRFGYFGGTELNSTALRRLETDAGIVHYLTELKPWLPRFPRGRQLDRYLSAYDRIAPLWGPRPGRQPLR